MQKGEKKQHASNLVLGLGVPWCVLITGCRSVWLQRVQENEAGGSWKDDQDRVGTELVRTLATGPRKWEAIEGT